MSTTSASTAPAPERLARADLCRFLAACYYEPGPEFVEERLFDSLAAVAALLEPELEVEAVRLAEAFRAESLENLLVDYTRLFVGPPQALATPYESAWANGPDETARVAALYKDAGFQVDDAFRDLPDHIAVELELLYRLLYEDAPSGLRRRLLNKHLGRWTRPFAQAVVAGAQTAFYRQLGELTQRVVASEAGRA